MGYFERARNIDVNGGNFIYVRDGQVQYTINPSMSIPGNNYSAVPEMYPGFRPHAQYTAYNDPRHGPMQSNICFYPGYVQSNMPYDNPPYTNPSHIHPPYTHPPYSPTMRPVAEQGNIHYHYHSCQFVLVPYQTGQQPYPYPPHPDQPYSYPSQPGQPYSYFPQPEQQPYHSPPQQFAATARSHPPVDPEDPDIAAIRHNLENQDLS